MGRPACRFTSLVILLAILLSLGIACGRTEEPTATSTPPTAAPALPTPAIPEAMRLVDPGWTSYTNANDMGDIAFDHDGNLWTVGSEGVGRRDPTDGTHTKYTTADFEGARWTTNTGENGLAGGLGLSIAVGPDDALWFGTAELCREGERWVSAGGVSRFDGERRTTSTTEDGLGNDRVVFIAVAPDGALWFNHIGTVSRFDGQAWTTHVMEASCPDERGVHYVSVISLVVAPDGVLWLGASCGVGRFDGES